MLIRKSNIDDLLALMPIFEEARKTIATLGIDQWQNGYPEENIIKSDIEKQESFLAEIAGNIVGTFVMILSGEPTYDKIYEGEWKSGNDNREYLTIHRVAISVVHWYLVYHHFVHGCGLLRCRAVFTLWYYGFNEHSRRIL